MLLNYLGYAVPRDPYFGGGAAGPRAPFRNTTRVAMCQIVPLHRQMSCYTYSYGKVVCRVLEVPVPLAILTETAETLCIRV